jgi:hypothetical protein
VKRDNRWAAVALAIAAAQLSGCQKQSTANNHAEHPAEVEKIAGSEFSKLTLTEQAMKRLDVRTAKVSEAKSPRKESQQRAVPYAAVIYDPHGKTWVYTSPQSRTFVRQPIEVDFVQEDVAYLSDGPPAGTEVATVGAAELYGTEFKVGH